MPTYQKIHVAVAVISYRNDYLLAKRLHHQHQGGKLEFVGGKIEKDERPVCALIREIKEELGVDIAEDDCMLMGRLNHDYDKDAVSVQLWVYRVCLVDGHALIGRRIGEQHQALTWHNKDELLKLGDKMPSANREILSWIAKSW